MDTNNVSCSHVNSLLTSEAQCEFLMQKDDCLDSNSVIDYLWLVYCYFGREMRILAVSLASLLLLTLFLALGIIADKFLCPNLLALAKTFRMSDSLAVSKC